MTLEQAVMQLHEVARLIEQQVGQGLLSEDVRNCADRLHTLTKYNYVKQENTNGVE